MVFFSFFFFFFLALNNHGDDNSDEEEVTDNKFSCLEEQRAKLEDLVGTELLKKVYWTIHVSFHIYFLFILPKILDEHLKFNFYLA